jgi:hypothetical protein
MKPKSVSLTLLVVAAVGFAFARLFAAPSAKTPAVETGKVVFENEKIRVIEYHTNGGKDACGAGVHSHPDHLYIMLTDAKFRTVLPDGTEELSDAKAGEVGWEAAATHRCENILGNQAGLFVIEIKDKNWKPSTGLSP